MNTVAKLPAKDRLALFTETAATLGLPPFHVEKDFWACWLLGLIFSIPELGSQAVFKGGTSLSKVLGAIARFSEDVDLGIIPAAITTPTSPRSGGILRPRKPPPTSTCWPACASTRRVSSRRAGPTTQPPCRAHSACSHRHPAGRTARRLRRHAPHVSQRTPFLRRNAPRAPRSRKRLELGNE